MFIRSKRFAFVRFVSKNATGMCTPPPNKTKLIDINRSLEEKEIAFLIAAMTEYPSLYKNYDQTTTPLAVLSLSTNRADKWIRVN